MTTLYLIGDVRDKIKKLLTLPVVMVFTSASEEKDSTLTKEINIHLRNLKYLVPTTFNWTYYTQKYADLLTIKTRQTAWEHWITQGVKEHRNPINQRLIASREDITRSLTFMNMLMDAHQHQFPQIMIALDPLSKTEILRQLTLDANLQTSQEQPLFILTMGTKIIAYLINHTLYDYLTCELSFFMTNFEILIRTFQLTYPDRVNINQTSHTSVAVTTATATATPDNPLRHVDMNLHDLTTAVNTAHQRYLEQEQPTFTDQTQLHNYRQLLIKYPYHLVKTQFNQEFNLDLPHYRQFCAQIIQSQEWLGAVKILPLAEATTDADFNSIFFHHDFYLDIYPCYRKNFKNQTQSYEHFLSRYQQEHLLPNSLCFQLMSTKQEYHLFTSLRQIQPSVPWPSFPLIYVLTRTYNREALFTSCCQSVREQCFVQVRHLVSYDDDHATKNYVLKGQTRFNLWEIINLCSKKSTLHPNQYIDLMYQSLLLPSTQPGWVMVLDDDDHFTSPLSLSALLPYLDDPTRLVMWKFYRPDKYIYPCDHNAPIVGEVASCAYIYHSSQIQPIPQGHWQRGGVGDFAFFKYIFAQTKSHIYLDLPLTGVNYRDQVSGWTAM